MGTTIYTDPTKRHDFLLLFDVTDGNPNGDPDAGNLPRVDPETMQGIVTDVCLKRKVRNYVLACRSSNGRPDAGYDIYVKERGVLNAEHRRAYVAKQIEVGQPNSETLPSKLLTVFVPDGEPVTLPEGLTLGEADETWKLTYSGLLDANERKDVLKEVSDSLGKPAGAFIAKVIKGARSRKPTRDETQDAGSWMCENFFDIRVFGAVMTTGVNCGQVRGPLQFTFARSIDPVVPLDISITRVAVTREEDAERKQTEMGRKALLPYGLYRGYGFFTPHFAQKTGVTADDLALFWEALQQMWTIDRSAARGMMALRGLYVFSHDSPVGTAQAQSLFERITVARNDCEKATRAFSDYCVKVNDTELPEGVLLTRLIG
jgi:CRISPR-associated protein Csd2